MMLREMIKAGSFLYFFRQRNNNLWGFDRIKKVRFGGSLVRNWKRKRDWGIKLVEK